MNSGQGQFQEVTRLFYEGEYQKGLQVVNRLLENDPKNSMLYSNRALFQSQLQKDQEAINDLNTSLLLNPLNYIAHFNLFSINVRNNQNIEAFQHLCCSLSCLYLIRAKVKASLADAERSLYFANNNIQAHLLSALLQLKNGQKTLAQQNLKNALQIDPENQIVLRVWKQLGLSGQVNLQGDKSSSKRLRGSVQVSEKNLENQINNKVGEFNGIYSQVNNTIGAVTQKVPKSTISHNIETFMRQSRQGVSKQPAFAVVHDPGVATPQRYELEPPIPAATEHGIQDQFGFEQFPSVIENPSDYIIVSQEGAKEQGEKAAKGDKAAKGEKASKGEKEETKEKEEIDNLIYPLDNRVQLGMKVLRLELQGENLERMKDVYCIISYDEGKNKVKTVEKPIQGGLCNWEEQFPPVTISEEPSKMKIGVYNKTKQSEINDLIGVVEVRIVIADLLRLPLYDKKGIFKAFLVLNLQLVQDLNSSIEGKPCD